MLFKMPRPNEDVSPSHGISTTVKPSFNIPPHVLGRTVHNPTIDTSGPGRRPQKPRPGMRVPYRNLTSQIVTQDEIAQEILKRQMKKNSANQSTVLLVDNVRGRGLHFGGSGDTTFAKSLSQKLANQLSSQADVEEKAANGVAGSNGVLWPQAHMETGEQFASSHYPKNDKQSAEVAHGDSNGLEVAIMSHKKPSISPRINHHKTSKLDKEVEKEIALKQLKELPMIKDSESAVRRKNLLKSDTNMRHSLSLTTTADLKNCNKIEMKDCSSSGEKCGVSTSGENSSDIGQTLLSTQVCGNVQLKNSEAKSVHRLISSGVAEGKGSDVLGKLGQPKKCNLKKTKLSRKPLKSNLTGGYHKKLKEMSLKRRSARLINRDDKDAVAPIEKVPAQEVPVKSRARLNTQKGEKASSRRRYSNQSRNSSSILSVSHLEADNVVSEEPSLKRPRISDRSSVDTSVCETPGNQSGLFIATNSKYQPICALTLSQKVIQLQAEMKENMNGDKISSKQELQKKPVKKFPNEVMKLIKDEGVATMLLETCSFNKEEEEYMKPVLQDHRKVMKRFPREVEKLIKDEGVVNMILDTSPITNHSVMKMERSQTKGQRATTRQTILYKARLARKRVLLSSSRSSRLRSKTLFKTKKDKKIKLAEKKRQLFAEKKESKLRKMERKGTEGKSGTCIKKVKEEKENGTVEENVERARAVEVIDISSPPKRERDSNLSVDESVHRVTLPLAAKASRIIRRHSSSSSFSSRSSSPLGSNCKSRRGSCNSNLPKEMSYSLLNETELGHPAVSFEPILEVQLKNNMDSNRLSCISRCQNTRKMVAVPRMSAAVRLKLNTEMSKNFQKGLNVEDAKNVSAKTSTSPRPKRSPVPSEQSLKLNSLYDLKPHSPNLKTSYAKTQPLKDVGGVKIMNSIDVIYDTQSISSPTVLPVDPFSSLSPNIQSSPPMRGLDLINGGELAVCVKKLQERKEMSITAISESGERSVEFTNNIPPTNSLLSAVSPETICAPSVVPKQTASSSGVLVEVVPKVKKFKNPKPPFLKNVMGKQHRIVGLPLSPIASYNSVMKSLENVGQKHKRKANSKIDRPLDSKESFRQRSSGRQNAGTYNYKEICLRRYENFVQVILNPGSTKMKNSLNVQVLHEFRDALQQLRRDEFCRVVLVTSTGSTFCQGVDLHSLLHTNIERRKRAALELSEALKEFLRVLAMFNKPIVAGVHGATVGLGVTMLPFFDVIYASDKATFHAPYARLGQIPEGAAVLTLPLMLGNAVTSELLFGSRKLTATEALHYGLVTRVFWPDTFQEEIIPNIKAMANQSSQSMQAMKALLRLNLRVKLEATLDSESSLLVQHWCSPECQRNFRKFLETSDEVFLQRQKKDPC